MGSHEILKAHISLGDVLFARALNGLSMNRFCFAVENFNFLMELREGG